MTTIKQEIKALKVGQEKIFKIEDGTIYYLTIRKSKAKGLEIILSYDENDYGLQYDHIVNNFRDFILYNEFEIDY